MYFLLGNITKNNNAFTLPEILNKGSNFSLLPNLYSDLVKDGFLKVCTWNIQHGAANKLNNPDCVKVFENNDIIFLSECWLNVNTKFNLEGYTSVLLLVGYLGKGVEVVGLYYCIKNI